MMGSSRDLEFDSGEALEFHSPRKIFGAGADRLNGDLFPT
jgi:hypothetical protein